MEAGELALYMFCACAFASLLQHPASPVRHFISSGLARRALYGLAMGSAVIGIPLFSSVSAHPAAEPTLTKSLAA